MMDNIYDQFEEIQRLRNGVLKLLENLKPFCENWSPPATSEAVEAYRNSWFPKLHDSLIDFWSRVNGLYVSNTYSDLIILGVPLPENLRASPEYQADVLDPIELLLPHIDYTRFFERGYIPISPDSFGNYYVADTHHQDGPLLPIVFVDHEAEYEATYLAASNLWAFLRFQIGYRIGVLCPDIAEKISDAERLMGDDPEKWPVDKDYMIKYDPWILDVRTDVPF